MRSERITKAEYQSFTSNIRTGEKKIIKAFSGLQMFCSNLFLQTAGVERKEIQTLFTVFTMLGIIGFSYTILLHDAFLRHPPKL